MRILILTFFAYWGISQVTAQQLYSHNWNIENGLPSNQTYSVTQDKKGFIWICTDHGVVRYDGQTFELFSTLNGLVENTVFRIYEDYKGRLWFLGMSGSLCYWDEEEIISHASNAEIQDIQQNKSQVTNIAIDSNDVIYFTGSTGTGYYTVGVKDSMLQYTPLTKFDGGSLLLINEKTNLLINVRNIYKEPKNIRKTEANTLPLVKIPAEQYLQREYQVGENEQQLFFRDSTFILFNRSTKKSSLLLLDTKHKLINSAYLDSKGHLWVSDYKEGLLYYGAAPFDNKPQYFFSNIQVASVYEDREGNYWVATLHKGVFLVTDWRIFHLLKDKDRIYKLLYNDEKLLALGEEELHQLNTSPPFQTLMNYAELSNTRFFDVKKWKNRLFFSNGYIGTLKNDELNFSKKVIGQNGKVVYVDEASNQVLIGSGNRGLIIMKNNVTKTFCKEYWINAIEKISKEKWLLGTTKGLYYYNQSTNQTVNLDSSESLFSQRILSLSYFQDYLLVGTRGYGILLVHPKTYKVIKQWNGLNELSSPFIHCVRVENDSLVWVGTNHGANRLLVQKGEIKKSISLNRQNYLPSNGVNDILIKDSTVWLATDNGIVHLPQQIFTSSSKLPDIPIYLKSIDINGEAFPLKASYDLDYSQQNIIVDFYALSFKVSNVVTYRYQLSKKHEKEGNWNYTKVPQINFNSLAPDNYVLRIGVRRNDGIWQEKELKVSFQISPHFTQTWLFFLGIGSLLLLILGIYTRSILIKKNLEKELVEAEQKALRSQMNPHFLFNAINSVFYFLYKNKKQGALDFLQKFARLMRSTLENTQQALVSLEDDLEHLTLYIEMEQERLSSGSTYVHDFQIAISEELTTQEWKIPPMLIQPLVENAIIHGLAPKEGARELRVMIEAFNTGLQIRVEDNGIGRLAAAEIKKQFFMKKTSQGLNLLQQRIKTMNQLLQIKMKLKIEDISSDSNCSTRCTIYLPIGLKNKYDA